MRRCIFHVDMDAFFASVEQRDRPELRGRPVIVGADPLRGLGRGVVAACSYEARRFGIRSALPIGRAYHLCPEGVYLRPDMARYKAASLRIRTILLEVTELVEPLSIDEAFLDVSSRVDGHPAALRLAARLKSEIHLRERLTASVGVASTKFVAKIASDLRKPDGLVLVREDDVQTFLDPLPASRIWGVGPKTEARLAELGVSRIGDLRRLDPRVLHQRFGSLGDHLWRLAQGVDPREVVVHREAKSIGQERTFGEDTRDRDRLEETLRGLSAKVAARLDRADLSARTVILKFRYGDFTTLTRRVTVRKAVCASADICRIVTGLLAGHRDPKRRIRLLGVGVSGLQARREDRQLSLF